MLLKHSFTEQETIAMCVQAIDRPTPSLLNQHKPVASSASPSEALAKNALTQKQHVPRKGSNRVVKIVPSQNRQNKSKKKNVSAASVATTAVIAGTTSAVSGIGVFVLQHIIGFSVYLAYSPTTALSQYTTAQIAASMSGAIVSSAIVSTIVNIAFGILITLSTIFVAVIVYNLFLSSSIDDELSVFEVIGHTASAVFRKIFG